VGNRELGAAGEEAACSFLRRRGYRIMDRNYRCPFGEIDVIARRGGLTVFCEVKTRSGGDFEEALGAVDLERREHAESIFQLIGLRVSTGRVTR